MRISVICLLLLSLAMLLWLMRVGERSTLGPEQAPVQQSAAPAAERAAQVVVRADAPAAVAPPTTGGASSVAAASARAAAAAPETSEHDLLEDGVWVDVDRTLRLAATQEGFNKLLQMLASSSSVEISQRQASYQNLFMSDPLYLSGDLQAGQVTCGESVCAAFVTAADAQQLSAFIARLRSSQRPPIYSLTALDAPAAGNRLGKRVIFSIKLVRDSKFSIRRRPRS